MKKELKDAKEKIHRLLNSKETEGLRISPGTRESVLKSTLGNANPVAYSSFLINLMGDLNRIKETQQDIPPVVKELSDATDTILREFYSEIKKKSTYTKPYTMSKSFEETQASINNSVDAINMTSPLIKTCFGDKRTDVFKTLTKYNECINSREGGTTFLTCYLLNKGLTVNEILDPEMKIKEKKEFGQELMNFVEDIKNDRNTDKVYRLLDYNFIEGLMKLDNVLVNSKFNYSDISEFAKPEQYGLLQMATIAHTNFFQYGAKERLLKEASYHMDKNGEPYDHVASFSNASSNQNYAYPAVLGSLFADDKNFSTQITRSVSKILCLQAFNKINLLSPENVTLMNGGISVDSIIGYDEDEYSNGLEKLEGKPYLKEFFKDAIKNNTLFNDLSISTVPIDEIDGFSPFVLKTSFTPDTIIEKYNEFEKKYEKEMADKALNPKNDKEQDIVSFNDLLKEENVEQKIPDKKISEKDKKDREKRAISKAETKSEKLAKLSEALKKVSGSRLRNSDEFNNLLDAVSKAEGNKTADNYTNIAKAAKAYIDAKGERARRTTRGADRIDLANLALDFDVNVKNQVKIKGRDR